MSRNSSSVNSAVITACMLQAALSFVGCTDSSSAKNQDRADGGGATPSTGSGGDGGGGGAGATSNHPGGASSGGVQGGGDSGSAGASAGKSGGGSGAGGAGTGAGPSSAGGGGSFKPPITVVDPPSGGQKADAGTTDLPLSKAPLLPGDVNVVPNRSSVVLYLPKVTNARDYRVFAIEDGIKVAVSADSREHIDGATLHCAGLRQRSQCDEGEILPVKYNNEDLDMPTCARPDIDRRPNVPTQLMQTIEIDGVGKDATLVVEAIDRQCPFPGLFGSRHVDQVTPGFGDGNVANATINGKAYTLKKFPDSFPLRTEAEIRKDYGSMILNGQAPNQPVLDPNSPSFPESPYIRVGAPAPADDPVVLGRSVIKVSSTGTATLPDGFTDKDYFDDFEDDTDQPKLVRSTDATSTLVGVPVNVLQTKKWIFYDVAAYEKDGRGFSDMFVNRGQINMVMAEPGAMSLQAMYPKKPVHLPDAADQYLHVTYQVQRNELPRRYENLTLCGSDQAGQTYDGDFLKAAPLPLPGFMDGSHARRTSPLGWNCIYLVPRGPGYWRLDGGDVNSHSDTSLRVNVVKTQPAATSGSQYDSEELTNFGVAIGPTQDALENQWERQIDTKGNLVGMWLDDHINVWQKVKFDVFLRRDRYVIYVDGEQRVCGDLSAAPLTMAEGALGFWHVLYHTSAEFTEIRNGQDGANPSTGQHHILHNAPFADQRSWDNVGFRENVALPANFDSALCK